MRLLNHKPSTPVAIALAALPFIAALAVYAIASHIRLDANPADKLLPSFQSMWDAFVRMATVPDRRSGDILLLKDTLASMYRLGAAMAISTGLALVFGVLIGLLPYARSTFASFISTFSLVPPITILPILFIVFGLGEVSKIALIIVGTAPVMIRSTAQAVTEIPSELMIKAQTLGASTWQIMIRVVLPQIMPKLILALRLALVPAWIFLVSAEAIASTEGLGYRIFLVRRYLAMNIILPYVIWITILAFIIDRLLYALSSRAFPWAHAEGNSL